MEQKFLTKYENELKSYWAEKGFDENQIQTFLLGYYKYDEKNFYSPKKCSSNFQKIFKYLETYSYPEVKKMFPPLSNEFEKVLKENDLTIDDAIALNRWSIIPNGVLNYKRSKQSLNKATRDILYDNVFDLIIVNEKYRKLLNFVEGLDLSCPLETIEKKCKGFVVANSINEKVIPGILFYLDEKMKIKSTTSSLEKVTTNQLSQNTIFYRGLNYDFYVKLKNYINSKGLEALKGFVINEDGYSSTSFTPKNGFINSYSCPVLIEIFAPKGSECFDMVNFTKFPDENEVLFNTNEMRVVDYKIQSSPSGNERILLKCFLLSKNKECYKDIGKHTTKIKYDEENE